MLQATADAASLAAAIDLPNQGQALNAARRYAELNMPEAIYGKILEPTDVEFGVWDSATRTLNVGATPADTVRVTVHRTAANDNALPVNFLRIIGLEVWDVSAESTAQVFKVGCVGDGLFSRKMVNISSNNSFIQKICVHGEEGVDLQQNNSFELGVIVSMPDPGTMLQLPASGMNGNPGLAEALRSQSLPLPMIDDVPDIIAKFLDPDLDTGDNPVIPDFINVDESVNNENEDFDFVGLNYPPGQGEIYNIRCEPSAIATIPNNLTLRNVAIISECRIGVGSGVTLENVVLASPALGNGSKPTDYQNISFASNVKIGAIDGCDPGGGVMIYSGASVHFSSTVTIHGLQTIAAGRVELGARDHGIHGISVQAGDDITMTANNEFGLCSGGADGVYPRDQYRLVN